jgi:hypothetical protein
MSRGHVRAAFLVVLALLLPCPVAAQSQHAAFDAFLDKGLDDWRRNLSCNVLLPEKEQQKTLELWAHIRKDLVDIAEKRGASPEMKRQLIARTEPPAMMKATTGTTGELIAFCQSDPEYFKRLTDPLVSTPQIDLERLLAQP